MRSVFFAPCDNWLNEEPTEIPSFIELTMMEKKCVVIGVSLGALVIAAFMHLFVGVAIISAIALFLGLEGTILLASALSPDHDQLKVARQSGALDADKFQTTVRYNRWFFYGGFGLLAASFVLSSIPG